MPILEKIADERPDLFIFLGDNIYADTTDMSVMKAKYAKLESDAGFRRLRQTCPILATWDDHDYGANDAGAEYTKKEESQRIFLDFWKVASDSPRRGRGGVYDAEVFGPEGRRLQVILLDTRYYRSTLKKGARRVGGPYEPSDDESLTMLGAAQWKWLQLQLRTPAEVRIIATSIQCAAQASGQETWSNLPRERQRLIDLIASTKAGGVVLISGDRHWAELSVVKEKVPYALYDLTSSSLNQPHPRGTPTENRHRALPDTYHQPNYGAIEIDWNADDPLITLKILDNAGGVVIEKTLKQSELQVGA